MPVSDVGANAWTLIDLLVGVGLLLSMLVGLWRGFVMEVMSLLAWVVAYFLAHWFGADMAQHVPVGKSGSPVNHAAGMVVVFVLAWLAWAMVAWAIGKVIRASVLSAADRALGAGFGLIRGVIVALVVCTVVDMTPLSTWDVWQSSRSVVWLNVLLKGLTPLLPEQVVKFLPEQS
ncbi:MAG: CvpA family protein [Acidobacteriota bacterium]